MEGMESRVRSLRGRWRGGLIVLAAIAALAAIAPISASARKPTNVTEVQLTMGDSLAFGYALQIENEHAAEGNPASAYEHGYANDYFKKERHGRPGLYLENVSCGGETTDSLIGNFLLGPALDAEHDEAPCVVHSEDGVQLHTEYRPLQSQLEFAIEALIKDQQEGTPVTTVTLNIGANDELAVEKRCETQVGREFEEEGKSQYGATPEEAVGHCDEAMLPKELPRLIKNIATIVYAIRNYGAIYAQETGEEADASQRYTGKLIFVESYDPYGNVNGTGELIANSYYLQHLINAYLTKTLTDEGEEAQKEGHEPFHVCIADVLPLFNPGGRREPERLQRYTNMANTGTTNGKADGPDVHPTPAGYRAIARTMFKDCG